MKKPKKSKRVSNRYQKGINGTRGKSKKSITITSEWMDFPDDKSKPILRIWTGFRKLSKKEIKKLILRKK